MYILLLSDCGGRFLVSVHLLLLFSHWFWPSLCYPSYISHLIVIMFLFRSQTPFLFHRSDPFTFLVIRTRAPLQESTSHKPRKEPLAWGEFWCFGYTYSHSMAHFLFKLEISLKCGPKSTLYPLHLSSFPFFHLCPKHFTASQKTLPSFSQI